MMSPLLLFPGAGYHAPLNPSEFTLNTLFFIKNLNQDYDLKVSVQFIHGYLLIVYLIFRKELHDNIQKEEANDLLLLRLNSLTYLA